jgi:hypothetical protein
MAGEFPASILSSVIASSSSFPNSNLAPFFFRLTSGRAIAAKFLMKMWMVPNVPRNPQTSVTDLQDGQLIIF